MKNFMLVAAASVVLLYTGGLTAQETPPAQEPETKPAAAPFARYLPSKVLFYLRVRDASAVPDIFKKSPVYRIWQEKDIQSMLKEPVGGAMETLEEGLKKFEKESGVKAGDILGTFEGELAFALVDVDFRNTRQAGGPMGGLRPPQPTGFKFVFSVDVGKKKDEFVKILGTVQDTIIKESGEDGPRPSSGDFMGHRIYSFGDADVMFSATWLDTRWVLSLDKAVLQDVIKRYLAKEAPADSLEADKNFAAVHKKCGGGREEIFLYGDTSSLAGKLKDSVPPGAGKMLADMGLFDSMFSGYGVVIEPDGTSRELSCALAPEGHKIFSLAGKSGIDRTLYLPAQNVILWLSASCDMTAGFNYIMNFLASGMREEGKDVAESLKGIEEMLGLRLEEDLLKSLGGTLNLFVCLPEGGGAFPELALTAGVADGELLDTAVKKFADKMGEDLKTADYMGYKLYYFSIDKFAGEDSEVPYWPAFARAKNMLLAASGPQMLKRMIMNLDKPPAPAGDIKAALAKTPKDACQFTYIDTRKAFSYLYNTLLPYMNKNRKDELPDFLDPAGLPPVEVFTKHLSYIYSFSIKSEKYVCGEVVSPAGLMGLPLAGAAAGTAVALPNMMESKQAAGEAMIIASLRTLTTCQEIYNVRFGAYADSLQALAEKDLIDAEFATGIRAGYILEMRAKGANEWHVIARPLVPGEGRSYYYADQSGIIRSSKTPDIGPDSPPLGGK